MEEFVSKFKDLFKDYGEIILPSEIEDNLEDLIGLEDEKQFLDDFLGALKRSRDFLDKLDLKINFSALLYGPPGTGKTTLVKAMAKKYEIPLLLVYADKLVGSYLGETMRNFGAVIDIACEIVEKINAPLVLFIDELDAIASERSNPNDVAEVKRSVVSFLQHFDKAFLKKIPLAVIAATNHEDLLDSAVWRRFTYNMEFKFPDEDLRYEILKFYLEKIRNSGITVNFTIEELKRTLKDENGNDRTDGFTGADIERAIAVSLLKAMNSIDKTLTSNMLIDAIMHSGGTKKHQEKKQTYLNIPTESRTKRSYQDEW
ncbi:MAG: AAA family ATPase [Candidatus Helarchaeota archaeon]